MPAQKSIDTHKQLTKTVTCSDVVIRSSCICNPTKLLYKLAFSWTGSQIMIFVEVLQSTRRKTLSRVEKNSARHSNLQVWRVYRRGKLQLEVFGLADRIAAKYEIVDDAFDIDCSAETISSTVERNGLPDEHYYRWIHFYCMSKYLLEMIFYYLKHTRKKILANAAASNLHITL